MYDVLSAIAAYVDVVSVVEVPLTPDFVPSNVIPVEL
jgi:hypothetical protein